MDSASNGWMGTARISGVFLLLGFIAVGMTDAAPPDVDTATKVDETTQAVPPKTITIAGVCADEAQEALANVKVVLYRNDYTPRTRYSQIQETRTDSEGRYRFTDVMIPVPQGKEHMYYVVVLTAPGRASQLADVTSRDEDSMQTVRMPPAAELTGHVTDPEGKPIAGAWVWLPRVGDGPFERIMSGKTDADGRYVVSDLNAFDLDRMPPIKQAGGLAIRASGCFLRVRHSDYAPTTGVFTRVPSTLDFVLDYGGTLEGQVIDAFTGKPTANVVVNLRPTKKKNGKNDNGENLRQTQTDVQGRYRVTGLGAGTYAAWARTDERTSVAVDSIPVAANQIIQAPALQLISGALIEGRVVDSESQPMSHDPKTGDRLSIGLHGPSYPKQIPGRDWCDVEDDGRFRIRVAPGRNFLSIESLGSEIWERTVDHKKFDKGIDVAAGETRQLLFRVRSEKR